MTFILQLPEGTGTAPGSQRGHSGLGAKRRACRSQPLTGLGDTVSRLPGTSTLSGRDGSQGHSTMKVPTATDPDPEVREMADLCVFHHNKRHDSDVLRETHKRFTPKIGLNKKRGLHSRGAMASL